MGKKIIIFVLFVFFFSSSFVALAEVPKSLNFQGRLTDNDGAPLTGTYAMTFSIYNAGGSSLWTETQSVNVQEGLYNVSLGSVNSLNLAFDQPYYLEVRIGAETLPRVPILSSAYSLNSDRLDGVSIENLALTTHEHSSLKNNSVVALDNGNVGIGTTAPATPLDVVKNQNDTTRLRVANNSTGIYAGAEVFMNNNVANTYFGINGPNVPTSAYVRGNGSYVRNDNVGIDIVSSGASGDIRFWTGGVNERIRIASTGNVGIGTTNPASKLHVSGGDIRISGGSFIDDGVTLNAPDYVFEPGYNLLPIKDLKTYLETHKHLPNIPDAATIKKEGLNLSQFNMRLLEKVEEQSLYIVELEERISNLEKALKNK